MKYIRYVNQLIREKVAKEDKIVLYGQNISAGYCLSGLTRNLTVKKGNMITNTPNSENTLAGLGFGLMLNGVSSIFFMKQQDFLLLGIDHLVNTYNFIRRNKPKASYTIMFIIVDQGFQGLQSSFNNFGDLCSIARVPGYTITNKEDAKEIIDKHLTAPGFRMIGVSQRLFHEEILDIPVKETAKDRSIFQYHKGESATIVCFNLSLPYGVKLHKKLKANNMNSSLFTVNAATPVDWGLILDDAKKTGNLVVVDDSKSENLSCDNLLIHALKMNELRNHVIIKRQFGEDWLWPNHDKLLIDYNKIMQKLKKKGIGLDVKP